MKNKIYPVGYTVMPVYMTKQLNECFSKDDSTKQVIAYMPSKCYIVSTEKKITKDGSVNSSYGVVYPFVPGKAVSQNYYMSNYPKYDSNGNCSNCETTQFLTDSFETAMKQAMTKNKELLNATNHSITSKTSYLTTEEKHKNLISGYMRASTFIEDMTSDIDVTINEYSAVSNKIQVLK